MSLNTVSHAAMLRGARAALNFVLPPRCLSCRGRVEDQGTLCAECWKGLTLLDEPCCYRCGYPFPYRMPEDSLCPSCIRRLPAFDRARAVFRYDDASRVLILAFKHSDEIHGAPMYGQWLARAGAALLDEGRTEEGVARLSEAVRLQPSFLAASNNLAWVLATSGDDGVRNPVLAVPLAQRAAAITGGTDPDVLDTLAAAYAAAGRFEEAVQAAERAVALAAAAGPTERADAIQTRLDLYRERRAYRDPSGEPSAP